MNELAVLIGVGDGLSAELARKCYEKGMSIVLASRNSSNIKKLAEEVSAKIFDCDVSRSSDVLKLFNSIKNDIGTPNLVVFNPSSRVQGDIRTIDPEKALNAVNVSCLGGFYVAREATKIMIPAGRGSIFFTGASASIKGFAHSSVFAMGKFGLRGLSQSLSRELQPKNIHICHFIIDGGIAKLPENGLSSSISDALLDPREIAKTYLYIYGQDKSAWSSEIELRPWVEKF